MPKKLLKSQHEIKIVHYQFPIAQGWIAPTPYSITVDDY